MHKSWEAIDGSQNWMNKESSMNAWAKNATAQWQAVQLSHFISGVRWNRFSPKPTGVANAKLRYEIQTPFFVHAQKEKLKLHRGAPTNMKRRN